MTNTNTQVKSFGLKKKLIIALCAIVGVVAISVTSVLATVAYLTSSAAVSNVFTVGNVTMKMTESKVNPNGTYVTDATNRTDTNTYHLVPGTKYIKDPVITIEAGSENSYLFALVRNDLETIAADRPNSGGVVTEDEYNPSIARQLEANGWAKFTKAATGWVYVYVGFQTDAQGNFVIVNEKKVSKVTQGDWKRDTALNAGELTALNTAAVKATAGNYPLFESFTISSDVTDTQLQIYNGAKVTITAAAIQATGEANFDLDDAWLAIVNTYPYIHTGH